MAKVMEETREQENGAGHQASIPSYPSLMQSAAQQSIPVTGSHATVPQEKDEASGLSVEPTIQHLAAPDTRKTLSQRRLQANRANAQKSTGPKSARGKAWSRQNSLAHHLTAGAVLVDSNGVPIDPETRQLRNRLKQQFGDDDLDAAALINQVAIEWMRQRDAMKVGSRVCAPPASGGDSEITPCNLLRYQSKSRRVLLKALQQLRRK